MRILFFISAFIFSCSALLAQSAEEDRLRIRQETESVVLEESGEESAEGEKQKFGHWDFSVGSTYAYMKGYGSGMMLYTAPGYTLSLNQRWSLHGGLIASHYQGINYSQPGEALLPGTFNSLAVFAEASYRMSERLLLHGAGIKQLVRAPLTPFAPYPMEYLSLGATYKIGNNLTIGASVHMRNTNPYQGFRTSPFGSPFYPSPFGW
ncbi:MAG: hypothetical protein P1P86_02460 [Bacteroidales bacterium]|nr:hypothetical protein [Bacteroidales bacterium]